LPAADSWRPEAGLTELRARAVLLAQLRAFFAARDILEVETPLLCSYPVTDPNVVPMTSGERWLQTSPEYAMKRLLAAGSGPIYQVCKAFRAGEAGASHNPEFTMLEWYRPGFELPQLMAEVGELMAAVLERDSYRVVSYREIFCEQLQLDPFSASDAELEACVRSHIDYRPGPEPRDLWLDLLLSHVIEPRLTTEGLLFVHDYPASQAALARLREDASGCYAERFELYVDGVELANGYCELTDAAEQRCRFEHDNQLLQARGQPPRPLDEWLLQALQSGLPMCSGVALGVDRLLQAKLGLAQLREGLSFPWERS